MTWPVPPWDKGGEDVGRREEGEENGRREGGIESCSWEIK